MAAIKMVYKPAQQVADFFQVYMARDSTGVWHAFRKKPTITILHLKDDDGNPVDCGHWTTPDGDLVAAITFNRGIRDDRDWKDSLTIPKLPKKNNGSGKGNFNKGNKNNEGKFNKPYQPKTEKDEPVVEQVVSPEPIKAEVADAIRNLFADV